MDFIELTGFYCGSILDVLFSLANLNLDSANHVGYHGDQ